MPLSGVALVRVQKELKMLYEEPPPGISAWAANDSNMSELEAVIQGADATPYANGRFRLNLSMPLRYPFEPPKVQFVTPIYHPNIDSAGRICLDILNLPPKGAWKPSLNISTVLSSLQLLMSEPNADDGLMVDITHQYIHDRARFERTATEHTRRYAMASDCAPTADDTAAASVDPPPSASRAPADASSFAPGPTLATDTSSAGGVPRESTGEREVADAEESLEKDSKRRKVSEGE